MGRCFLIYFIEFELEDKLYFSFEEFQNIYTNSFLRILANMQRRIVRERSRVLGDPSHRYMESRCIGNLTIKSSSAFHTIGSAKSVLVIC